MEVTIKREETYGSFGDLIFKVYIQLFLNDSKVDILTIPVDLLSKLVEKYVTGESSTSSTQMKEKILFGNLGFVTRTIRTSSKNASISDLRTINIFTIDKFANTTIGRTIIELDADIITLLPQNVIDRNLHSSFRLHSFSIFLITQYLKHLMEEISGSLKNLSNAMKIASFMPFGISALYTATEIMTGFQTSDPQSVILGLMPLIISTVVTPLLYKYVPRMVIRALIGYFFKTASS